MAISMKIRLLAAAGLAIVPAVWSQTAGQKATPAQTGATTPVQTAATERTLLNQYCVGCHNQKAKAAGQAPAMAITLDNLDTANIAQDPDKWEHVVRKTRAGMMPPPGLPRP